MVKEIKIGLEKLNIDYENLAREMKKGNITPQEFKLNTINQYPKESKENEDWFKLFPKFELRKLKDEDFRKYFVPTYLKIKDKQKRIRFVREFKSEVFIRFMMKLPLKDFKKLNKTIKIWKWNKILKKQ